MTSLNPNSPPPATILGIGAITPLGRDLQQIAQKLAEAPPPYSPLLRISDDSLADPNLARSLRRADRFVRMASLAALDAWTQAKPACADVPPEKIGLIVTSGLGPHCRGFKFLDEILLSGDDNALPTDFSHSVHGAAASYIAGLLDLRGPSLTTTDFEIGFEQAILLAQSWLHQNTCQRVVIGAVEELGDTLIKIASQILQKENQISLGEGAVFLTLAPAHIPGFTQIDATPTTAPTDLLIQDHPPIPANEISPTSIHAKNKVTFNPWFGHSATTTAFNTLGAVLSLNARTALGKSTGQSKSASPSVDNATTFRTSCHHPATLRLTAIREL